MKELKCDVIYDDSPVKSDSITATTTSDTESECTSCSTPNTTKSTSPTQSLSSLSCEDGEDEKDSNIQDEELDQVTVDYPMVHMYSYSPQCEVGKRGYIRSKIREEELFKETFGRVTLPRKKKPYRNNFILSLVLVGSLSLIVSSLILTIYSPLRSYPSNVIDEKQLILQDVFSQEVTDEQFTIRISASHGRLDLVSNSIDSHSACPRVKQIQVDWVNMKGDPPEVITDHYSHKVAVVKSSVESSAEVSTISTNAVLLLSDDVVLTCNELDRGFQIWKQHPDRMVGFFPYHYQQQTSQKYMSNFFKPSYRLLDVQNYDYSILSDRASFIHRLYLRTTVDSWMTTTPCKSIALSLKITSISKKSPMTVASKPLQVQTSATLKHINKKRHEGWLNSCKDCLSSILSHLQIDHLPINNRFYVVKTR